MRPIVDTNTGPVEGLEEEYNGIDADEFGLQAYPEFVERQTV